MLIVLYILQEIKEILQRYYEGEAIELENTAVLWLDIGFLHEWIKWCTVSPFVFDHC